MPFSTFFNHRFFPISRSLFVGLLFCFVSNLSAQVILKTETNLPEVIDPENPFSLNVDITVENFDNIAAMQFTLNWDPAVLLFSGRGSNPADLELNDGNFNLNLTEQGRLPIAWFTNDLEPVSLPDGSTIINLTFLIISNNPVEIGFGNDPTPIEFVDGDGELLTFSSPNNTVEFVGQLIEGRIFSDTQMDCAFQENELGLNNWMVEINNGLFSRFARTNEDGEYSGYLSPDTYTVRPILPDNGYWSLCNSEQIITITEDQAEPSNASFGAIAVVDCPAMKVNVSTAFLRRCFDNIYQVEYCNQGTVEEEDVYIVLNFCLLYTSPSPRDATLSRMPSSA